MCKGNNLRVADSPPRHTHAKNLVRIGLSENEDKNLQNGDVHLAQIPDFEMGYLEDYMVH